jgi:cytochrome c551/c552
MALLVLGGFAIYLNFSPTGLFVGYIPTLSSDPQAGQLQALILVGGVGGGLVTLVVLGGGLAFVFNYMTKQHVHILTTDDSAAPAKPAPKGKGEAPQVPLSDTRSLAVFWGVLLLFLIAFFLLNYAGASASPVPSLSALASMPIFKLPGEHIKDLPPFIAGPGDDVTAMQLFIAVLGGVLVGTIVVGIALARGTAVLDVQVKSADKAPRTVVDNLLATVDARIQDLRSPKAPRPPANSFDRWLIGLDVLLLLVVAGIVAVYVVPSYTGVAAVDNAVEATRIAALVTPTPAGPKGQSPIEALQAEFDKLPKGNPTTGQALFSSKGCVACHSLQPDVKIVGPSQAGIATRAATRKPGYSAELYIYESITRPNAYVVDGFLPDLMPQTFKDTLTPQELADVIAFFMTLK